jgi:2-dehydro-3-deoxy-L-rhamnonate dehydrogenase (NAD+)
MSNHIDLSGRVAVVTGGTSGIGFAAAQRLLQSGAVVEIWGRNAERIAAAVKGLSDSGPVRASAVDVSNFEQVSAAAEDAERQHGRVDILLNSAGMLAAAVPVHELSQEAWEDSIATNLSGVFYTCKAFLPGMLSRRCGRIINVASMAGKEGNPFLAAYSATKAGVIGFTKAIAKEFATSGVTANCVVPTLVETPMVETASRQAPENLARTLEKIPMARMGRPEEVAAMIAWLASDECSFTTGFGFDLSGGRATY